MRFVVIATTRVAERVFNIEGYRMTLKQNKEIEEGREDKRGKQGRGENPLIERLLTLPQDRMLTPKDLVSFGIGQSETRLYHMRVRGDGPVYTKIPRRTYLYAPTDVVSWLRSCQSGSSSSQPSEVE